MSTVVTVVIEMRRGRMTIETPKRTSSIEPRTMGVVHRRSVMRRIRCSRVRHMRMMRGIMIRVERRLCHQRRLIPVPTWMRIPGTVVRMTASPLCGRVGSFTSHGVVAQTRRRMTLRPRTTNRRRWWVLVMGWWSVPTPGSHGRTVSVITLVVRRDNIDAITWMPCTRWRVLHMRTVLR